MLDCFVERGWLQHDFFLDEKLTIALASECTTLKNGGVFKLAGVGRGGNLSIQTKVRSDQIMWLADGQSIACDQYLQIMENVRLVLNRHLFLGLEEYESHFAFYEPGASYSKHLDRFRDDDHRMVSAVIYLNANWLPEQGGAIRLHPEGKDTIDISPNGGRLVLFFSADLPHEVMQSTRDRLSIAGWFRRRN